MVKKISIVRTEQGATISVVTGDHVYRETFESWDQALRNVVALHSWTQGMSHVPSAQPSRNLQPVSQSA